MEKYITNSREHDYNQGSFYYNSNSNWSSFIIKESNLQKRESFQLSLGDSAEKFWKKKPILPASCE